MLLGVGLRKTYPTLPNTQSGAHVRRQRLAVFMFGIVAALNNRYAQILTLKQCDARRAARNAATQHQHIHFLIIVSLWLFMLTSLVP